MAEPLCDLSGGELRAAPLAAILLESLRARLTGEIKIDANGGTSRIYVRGGQPCGAQVFFGFKPFGQYLLELGWIDLAALEKSLAALAAGKKQGEALVEMGCLTEEKLQQGLSLHHQRHLRVLATVEEGTYAIHPTPRLPPWTHSIKVLAHRAVLDALAAPPARVLRERILAPIEREQGLVLRDGFERYASHFQLDADEQALVEELHLSRALDELPSLSTLPLEKAQALAAALVLMGLAIVAPVGASRGPRATPGPLGTPGPSPGPRAAPGPLLQTPGPSPSNTGAFDPFTRLGAELAGAADGSGPLVLDASPPPIASPRPSFEDAQTVVVPAAAEQTAHAGSLLQGLVSGESATLARPLEATLPAQDLALELARGESVTLARPLEATISAQELARELARGESATVARPLEATVSVQEVALQLARGESATLANPEIAASIASATLPRNGGVAANEYEELCKAQQLAAEEGRRLALERAAANQRAKDEALARPPPAFKSDAEAARQRRNRLLQRAFGNINGAVKPGLREASAELASATKPTPQPVAPAAEPLRASSSPSVEDERFAKLLQERHATIASEDLFSRLGVSREASRNEIKQAFFAAAKLYHPDKIPPALAHLTQELKEIFAAINDAYQLLQDDERRRQYARQLERGEPRR